MPPPRLDFWYDFASTYSYLTAMRIEGLAHDAGVEVRWRPFLLGPIFKRQGWETSPFKLQKDKGLHMVRDMERICADRGLTFQMPDPFPQNSVYAARLAMLGAREGWAGRFTRLIFCEQFSGRLQIDDKIALGECLTAIGLDGDALLARIEEDDVKSSLRQQTQDAEALGIFGAPTFITEGGEVFWGDDRLEQAIEWPANTQLRRPI